MSKLNDGQRGEVYALLDSGVSYQSIADKFGVSRQAISKIADRKLKALASNVVAEEVARNQNVVAATEVAPQPKLPPQPDSSQKTRLPQPVVAPATLVAATNSGLPATNPQPKTANTADTLTIEQVTIPRDMYVWLRTFHEEKTWARHLWSPAGADDLARLTAQYNRQIEDGEWVVRRPKVKPNSFMSRLALQTGDYCG